MTSQEWYHSAESATFDDLQLTYRKEGSGPLLLCIHGFPSSSFDFEKLWHDLVDHFTVLAPDLIGLGMSSKPRRPISIRLQADMIEALIVSLQPSDHPDVHILAHDLGDTIAQELLARQLDGSAQVRWKSCILLNGGIFPETHRPLLVQKLLISPMGGLLARFMTRRTFSKQMLRIFSKEHPPEESFINGTWQLIISDHGKQAIPRLIRYMEERRKNRTRWVGALQGLEIPLRLINGTQDPISGAHAADRFEELIPNPDVVRIPDAGHYPHVETPEKVWAAIQEFLTR